MSRLLVIEDGLGIRKEGLTLGMTPGRRLRDQLSRGAGPGNTQVEQCLMRQMRQSECGLNSLYFFG